MYRNEVPLYGDLIDIVASVNDAVLAGDDALHARLSESHELERLTAERHGAIRVGTAEELSTLRRVFAIMGMYPVGYYDLTAAGVPVHSTAFRPIDPVSLNVNPFRVFTSLLRLDLLSDQLLAKQAAMILASRQILSDRALALVAVAEQAGGLTQAQADEFVAEMLQTFRWQSTAIVDRTTYTRFCTAHRLIADVVSFGGPHINHLTPRTLDIDAAQAEMPRRGIEAKSVIEGPPRRTVPVLLRQTSFKALDEPIFFGNADAGDAGTHTARFGEIEQRGVALTRIGRDLYDACLDEACSANTGHGAEYASHLGSAFNRFPDDIDVLRNQGLAYFRYCITPTGQDAAKSGATAGDDIEYWIEAGWATAEPIVYEDFLPVSAAGIFQSNLGDAKWDDYAGTASRQDFEAALGAPVHNPFDLYDYIQDRSREALKAALGGPVA